MLFRLTLSDYGWDCLTAAVVRAATEQEARELAATACGDEGPKVWMDSSKTRCEVIDVEWPAEIVCTDFSAG